MKIKGYIASIVSLLVVYGLANAILFMLIPEGRTDLSSFWIAWSFTFPFGLLTTLGITFYCTRSNNSNIVKVPVLFAIQYGFLAVYFIIGLIFMIIGLEKTTAVWIIELIITAAYIIAMMYSWLGTSYTSKNIEHTKAKVFYIKALQADVENCIPKVNDEAIAKSLKELSEKIRFSDPMSHASLQASEIKIQDLVSQIIEGISLGNYDEISTLITKASIELDSRNNKCKILK